MKIKDLCEEERPREKLLNCGAKELSNSELLAILLRTGTGQKNVVEVAQEVLASTSDGLNGLANMEVEQLCHFKGIGPDKAASLAAAFEIGYRCAAEKMRPQDLEIRSPEDVFRVLYPKFAGLNHEECWIIYLNRSHKIIGTEKISSGGMSETTIDLANIARRALMKKASALVITHNHPSGNPTPSRADIVMTGKLKEALALMEISLVDHVVVTDACYYSFADEETRYYAENFVSE